MKCVEGATAITIPTKAPLRRQLSEPSGSWQAVRIEVRCHRLSCPSLVRSREFIADLQAYCTYDSSIPTSGGAFPLPNKRPHPRDGSMRFLGHDQTGFREHVLRGPI
jgi:hypothetical protein